MRQLLNLKQFMKASISACYVEIERREKVERAAKKMEENRASAHFIEAENEMRIFA
jgi:hypothetical protein